MSDIYLTIADGFEKLAAGYRALAQVGGTATAEEKPTAPKEQKATPTAKELPKVTIEQVRAVLAEKSKNGKRKEVKDLLFKYDSGKLSGVDPKDYPALLADAEVL